MADPVHGWRLTDYGGLAFALPLIAGIYAGKGLVVVGDAACVWSDLETFGCRVDHHRGSVAKDGFDFMTINKIVEVFPGHIEHAYSNEPSLLEKFIAARRSEYTREFDGPRHRHSCNEAPGYHRWPWSGWGTSTLGGCFAGIGMGYEPVVICGAPLDDGPHNGEPPWRKGGFTREAASTVTGGVNHHWRNGKATGRLFSMSGRTRDWLGAPP